MANFRREYLSSTTTPTLNESRESVSNLCKFSILHLQIIQVINYTNQFWSLPCLNLFLPTPPFTRPASTLGPGPRQDLPPSEVEQPHRTEYILDPSLVVGWSVFFFYSGGKIYCTFSALQLYSEPSSGGILPWEEKKKTKSERKKSLNFFTHPSRGVIVGFCLPKTFDSRRLACLFMLHELETCEMRVWLMALVSNFEGRSEAKKQINKLFVFLYF